MKKIALTGTIAAGKSTVSLILKKRRMPVFNCDQYSKMTLHQGNVCYEPLIAVLGKEVCDNHGDIDTHKMASMIFTDEAKRKAVNGIVHPYVKEGMRHFFQTQAKQRIVFAEVPLLFEAHWEKEFDQIWVVTSSRETAIERMIRDRGYSKKEANERYSTQIDIEQQKALADVVIMNEGNMNDLQRQVNQCIAQAKKGE